MPPTAAANRLRHVSACAYGVRGLQRGSGSADPVLCVSRCRRLADINGGWRSRSEVREPRTSPPFTKNYLQNGVILGCSSLHVRRVGRVEWDRLRREILPATASRLLSIGGGFVAADHRLGLSPTGLWHRRSGPAHVGKMSAHFEAGGTDAVTHVCIASAGRRKCCK
jgi:hypothetical protein